MNKFNWIGIMLLNSCFVIALIGLQFLYYGTAPAIDPNFPYKDNIDKKTAIIQAAMHFNKTLVLEIVVAAIIVCIMNFKIFQKKKKNSISWTLLTLLIFIILTGVSLTYFTIDYINRNMAISH